MSSYDRLTFSQITRRQNLRKIMGGGSDFNQFLNPTEAEKAAKKTKRKQADKSKRRNRK